MTYKKEDIKEISTYLYLRLKITNVKEKVVLKFGIKQKLRTVSFPLFLTGV